MTIPGTQHRAGQHEERGATASAHHGKEIGLNHFWHRYLMFSYFQLLSATFSYFQLLSATFSYFQLLSATFSYFQLLSVTFSYMSATTVPHAIHEQYTRGGPIKHTVGHFCPLFTQLIEKVGVFANLRFARFLARFAQTNSHTIFLTTANVFTSCRRSFASRPNHVSSRRRRVCVALGPTLGGRDCQYPTL